MSKAKAKADKFTTGRSNADLRCKQIEIRLAAIERLFRALSPSLYAAYVKPDSPQHPSALPELPEELRAWLGRLGSHTRVKC